MKRSLTLAAVALLILGCTPAPAQASLKQSCDSLQAVTAEFGKQAPDAKRYGDYLPRVRAISDAGDPTTKEAFAPLLAAFEKGAASGEASLGDLTTAMMGLLLKCAAAGSTFGSSASPTASPTATPSPSASAETATVNGSLRVELDVEANADAGNTTPDGPCIVSPDYDEVSEGLVVTIRDDDEVVGRGQLLNSRLQVTDDGETLDDAWCEFAFSVENVPMGRGSYSISAGHRGSVDYTEADLFDDPVLTLGDIPK